MYCSSLSFLILFINIFIRPMQSSLSQQHYSTQSYEDQPSIGLITEKIRNKHNKNHSSQKISTSSNSNQLPTIKKNPSPQKLMKNRFSKHLKNLRDQIVQIEQNSEQYGGSDHLYSELSRHRMTFQQKQEYEQQHRKRIFSLPKLTKPKKIKINSQENDSKDSKTLQSRTSKQSNHQNIENHLSRAKSILKSKDLLQKKSRVLSLQASKQLLNWERPKAQIQHNKWYIKPDQRFKIDKKNSVYDWNKNNFYLNIIKTRGLVMNDPHIHGLVNATRQKIGRDPLFCKYSQIKTNQYRKK